MLEAEFDQFAAEYHAQHERSIRLSGEAPEYFARYKIDDIAARFAKAGVTPRRILDFGAGVGNSYPYLRSAFPESEIVLLDPSEKSLNIARNRFGDNARFQKFDGEAIPFTSNQFDLILAACVFHHIPSDNHLLLLKEIRRVLSPGGSFYLFEHNPLNPLTLHAVRNCPFDENAVLIRSGRMAAHLREAGLASMDTVYRFFFPHALAALRPLERYLGKLPFGAQYFVHAVKHTD